MGHNEFSQQTKHRKRHRKNSFPRSLTNGYSSSFGCTTNSTSRGIRCFSKRHLAPCRWCTSSRCLPSADNISTNSTKIDIQIRNSLWLTALPSRTTTKDLSCPPLLHRCSSNLYLLVQIPKQEKRTFIFTTAVSSQKVFQIKWTKSSF